MKRALRRFFPPLLLMAAIHLLSRVPGTIAAEDPEIYRIFIWTPPAVQNLLHVPVFALLAWLWSRALEGCHSNWPTAYLLPLLITAAYGLFDEWWQLSVPGRYASLTDLGLNLLGAFLGLACRVCLKGAPSDRQAGGCRLCRPLD